MQAAPGGSPEQDNAIVPVNPFKAVTWIALALVVWPFVTVSPTGDISIEKSGTTSEKVRLYELLEK